VPPRWRGGGGPRATLGVAARHAYTTGLELALAAGACCVAVTAASVYLALRPKPPEVVNSRSNDEVPVSS
jgi:hypothetical protein